MKKYPQLFLVLLMPYVIAMIMLFAIVILSPAVRLLMLISAVAAIATAVHFHVKKKSSEEVLGLSKQLKLIQIPAYILIFAATIKYFWLPITGAIITLISMMADCIAIFSTGIIGLSGVILAYKENKLSKKAAVVNGMLQFIFCADIFSTVWVYKKVKEEEKINEEVL